MSRGDRRLAGVIEEAWRRGARLDAWSEHFNLATWEAAARAVNIDLTRYLRRRDLSEVLPWDHLDTGVSREFLLAELEKSKQPYYFMVSLADIEQRAENYDAAVDWLKQAYDSTTGPATRFQWGYYYLAGLLEMKPEETELIHSVTVELIDELQNSGGLYHRPKAQLALMEQRLQDWSEANGYATELANIRESVLEICATAAHQGDSRATCDAFLENV